MLRIRSRLEIRVSSREGFVVGLRRRLLVGVTGSARARVRIRVVVGFWFYPEYQLGTLLGGDVLWVWEETTSWWSKINTEGSDTKTKL